jgi:hypothetical protein
VRQTLRDLDVTDVHVKIHYRRGNSGHTTGHYRPWWIPSDDEDRAVIRVGLPKPGVAIDTYAPYVRRDAPPKFELRDWREALIALVAHEGMHHRQTPRNAYRSSRQAMYRGRHRYVESECDWAAYRAVKRWEAQ